MKKKNYSPLTLVLGLLFCMTPSTTEASITPDNQREIDRLNEMTQVLHSQGIKEFLRESESRGWSAPKMFSAWYISRLPDDPDGLKKAEEAKSKFGLEFAKQYTALASIVRESKDIVVLEEISEVLFKSTTWLNSKLAYNNLFLQYRAYDIGSVAAVKFMADLTYPMENAEKAMRRFDWQWSNAENRRIVLFEESSGNYFKPRNVNISSEDLSLEWRKGVSAALEYPKNATPYNLEIFNINCFEKDDIFGMPEFVWTKRCHFAIGQSDFGSVNLRNLAHLHEFRKRYGVYPVKPTKDNIKSRESDIKAAFWELSWRNHVGVSGAAGLYEAYLTGRLSDSGYQAYQSLQSQSSHLRQKVEK